MEEYEEAKETTANVEFIQNYFEDAKAANTYADYSCCVNIVEYDTYNVNGRKLYAYEGKLTESKIRKVNELLNFPVRSVYKELHADRETGC